MPALGGVNSTTSVATSAELTAHTDDATAAHAASAIAFTPAGTVAATTVQAAIEEVAAEASGSGIPQGGPLSEPLDADGNAIIGLPDPTDPQDAATKASSEAYTDAAEDNLSAFLYIRRAIVDLDAADIATLSSVPVEVVEAPGVDKMVGVVGAAIHFAVGTEPFATSPALHLFIGPTDDDDHRLMLLAGVGLDQIVADRAFQMQQFQAQDFAGRPGIETQPVSLAAVTEPGATGSILTASVDAAGTGYEVDDTITLDPSGELTVVSVGGAGEVETFTVTDAGAGYLVGSVPGQDTTSGVGVDFVLAVDTITPLSDGTARLTVLYYVFDLAS